MKKATKVSDFMTRKVITLNEEDDLSHLEEGMEQFNVRHIPVVDGNQLVGLISHRDVLRVEPSVLQGSRISQEVTRQRLESTFVADIMKRNIITVSPDTPIAEAAKLIVDNRIGCLPVVEADNKLVGIITEHDFTRLVAEDDG